MIKNLLLVLSVIGLASLAFAAEAPSEMINKVTCVKDGDTRELEIVSKDGGHTTNYTKAGEMKEVATCSMTKEKCQSVFDSIKGKLEAAGFECKI